MRSFRFKKVLLSAVLVFGISAPAVAQMALDLNPASGDQGLREDQVSPGEVKTVELVATGGAKGIIGYEVVLKYDGTQVAYTGFKPQGIMAGAMAIPQEVSNGVRVSVAFMGGKTSSEDVGTLGQFQFKVLDGLKDETKIGLADASYGKASGTQKLNVSGGVKLINAKASKPQGGQGGPPPSGQGGPPVGPPPPGGQGGPPGSQGGPPPPGGQGGPPMGPPPPGGQGGPPGGQGGNPMMMGQGGPPMMGTAPEDVIKTLPAALQGSFKQTLDVQDASEKAHLEAELKLQTSIRQTLEDTKQYLPKASDAEKENIAKALWYFGQAGGPPGGPMGPPPAGPGGQGSHGGQAMMGQGGPSGKDVASQVDQMIQETDQRISQLKQALQEM